MAKGGPQLDLHDVNRSMANSAARALMNIRHLFEETSMSDGDRSRNRSVAGRSRGMKLVLLGAAAMVAVATRISIGVPPAVRAQDTTDWQTKAGGRMAFDVASVKLSKPDTFFPPTFPLDSGDAFTNLQMQPPNGRFSATAPLSAYISFAYKLHASHWQLDATTSHLPKWGDADRFEIQARAPANTTKDQMRLMMQSLLAERFQLAVHFETREVPVLAMTLIKLGKPGPALRPHDLGPPCDAPPTPDLFPAGCGIVGQNFLGGGQRVGSGRNVTMTEIAGYLPGMGILDRPVIDRTGLAGKFDLKIQWKPDPESVGGGHAIPKKGSSGPVPPPTTPSSEPEAEWPSFIQALREQAGLKLESTKGPVDMLVIDHVERPSEN
jgi:bla regulator protein blaR1